MTFYEWLTLAPYFSVMVYLAMNVGILVVVLWATIRASGVSLPMKTLMAFGLMLIGGFSLMVVHGVAGLYGPVASFIAVPFDIGIVFGYYRFSKWYFGKLGDPTWYLKGPNLKGWHLKGIERR